MSGACADCGGPDYQTLEARIAELEAENHNLSDRLSAYIIERGIADTVRTELEAKLATSIRYGKAQNQALGGCAAEQAATVANRDELIRMVVSLKAALVERERL